MCRLRLSILEHLNQLYMLLQRKTSKAADPDHSPNIINITKELKIFFLSKALIYGVAYGPNISSHPKKKVPDPEPVYWISFLAKSRSRALSGLYLVRGKIFKTLMTQNYR